MIARKTVHPNLVRAYREAIYIVNEGDDAIALKVGEVSHALATLMRVHKVQTAAIITAYNPFSEIQPLARRTSDNKKPLWRRLSQSQSPALMPLAVIRRTSGSRSLAH
jgi:hypothetical protein